MIRSVILLWLCLGLPAFATQDQWPALFDVVNVASDDRLNVRAAPDADAEIIGSFGPDDVDIEVIIPNARHTWGWVNLGEETGWVSLAFLRRQPGQWAGAFPQVRQCAGTEPFWSFTRDPEGRVAWSEPEVTATGNVAEVWGSENRRDRHALTARFDPGSGPAELFATLSVKNCKDGMSDRLYGIAIDLLVGDLRGARMLSGCCTLSP